MLGPLSINLVQLFVENTLLLKVLESLVELQSRARVLDRVVRICLNVLVKHKPGEETKRKATLAFSQKVKIHRIYHLLWRDVDVYKRPIVSENMSKMARAH